MLISMIILVFDKKKGRKKTGSQSISTLITLNLRHPAN